MKEIINGRGWGSSGMKDRAIQRAIKEIEKVKILIVLWMNLAGSCNRGMALVKNIYLKAL